MAYRGFPELGIKVAGIECREAVEGFTCFCVEEEPPGGRDRFDAIAVFDQNPIDFGAWVKVACAQREIELDAKGGEEGDY